MKPYENKQPQLMMDIYNSDKFDPHRDPLYIYIGEVLKADYEPAPKRRKIECDNNNNNNNQFQIFIRTYFNGYQTVTIDVEEHDSIHNVLCKLCEKINIPVASNIRMVYQAKGLDGNKSIKYYNIKRGSTIHCNCFMPPITIKQLSKHSIQQMVNINNAKHVEGIRVPRLQVLNIKEVNTTYGYCRMILSDGQHYIYATLDRNVMKGSSFENVMKKFAIIDLSEFRCSICTEFVCVITECQVVQQIDYKIGNPKDIFVQFKLYVNFFGKTIVLKCKNTTRVKDVKKIIYKKERIAVKRQALLFNGKSLHNSRTLMYYNIKKYDKLHLLDKNDSIKVFMEKKIAKLQKKKSVQ
eukprot:454698_1